MDHRRSCIVSSLQIDMPRKRGVYNIVNNVFIGIGLLQVLQFEFQPSVENLLS